MRILFLIPVGLGDHVAEAEAIEDIPARLAQEFIYQGRAIPAPGEVAPDPPTALTTESLSPEPDTPKKGGKR
jgi:hypothetical protein